MRLENKFFNSFFYPILVADFFSTLVVTIFLGTFTNNNYCEKTKNNIINLEKSFSEINIKSVNILLTTSIQKIQVSLNGQIISYQKIAKKLIESNEDYELNNTFLKCRINIGEDYCENYEEESTYTAIWLLDNKTTENDLNDESKKDVKKQLIVYSNIIQNIDANL